MTKKIVLIMPYYGRLPNFFNYWLKSVDGKAFDVLWVSDIELPWLPKNVRCVRMSIDEFKKLAILKLGTNVFLSSPRRLCDFKPMYGRIFEEFIKGYHYWAHGDCDLVYGDKFNEFLISVVSSGEYDVVSLRKLWMSGPFGIYRNDEECCRLYERADNWKEVVACKENRNYLFFDECGGRFHGILESGKMSIEDCQKVRDSMTAVLARSPDVRWYHEDVITECALTAGKFVRMCADGRLFLNDVEIPIFHYISIKFRRFFYDNIPRLDRDSISEYLIDDCGFYVTGVARCFRRAIRILRKVKSAVTSLKVNGLGRVKTFWKGGF